MRTSFPLPLTSDAPTAPARYRAMSTALVLALTVTCRGQAPSGGGLRGPTHAAAGSTVTIDAGTNDGDITVVDPTTGASVHVPAAPGKGTEIPMPNAPGGTIVIVRVGRGLRCSYLLIEIVEAGP